MSSSLVARILQYMQLKKYTIFTQPCEYNIVYVEGMNPDGTLNSDSPNMWNDIRLLIERNSLVDVWTATTEPGRFYTLQPLNERGAARIKFGQYQAWQVGMHGNADRHEALVQVRDVPVHRDLNKDFKRTGDAIDTGLFGINQHWGYDYPYEDIGVASAGCLVGRLKEGHREFMHLIKQDPRYKQDRSFIFTTTIIPGDEVTG